MSQKSKITRTQIADLPEINVELTEAEMQNMSGGLRSAEMRIVSGGLKSGAYGCGSRVAFVSADRTQYNTNGDWDSD